MGMETLMHCVCMYNTRSSNGDHHEVNWRQSVQQCNFCHVCDSFAANDPSPAKVSERNGEREVLCTFLIEVVGGWEEAVE